MYAFNAGWTVSADESPAMPARLPHDAMLSARRSADAPSGSHGGYFHGGCYRYEKRWHRPAELAGKRISLLFEGVYRHAEVRVNGSVVGGWIGGYDEFEVRIDDALTADGENVIEVLVDNMRQPSGRWYTGSGIYRPVWLRAVGRIHFHRDGVVFRTTSLGTNASAVVELAFDNPDGVELTASARLERPDAPMATAGARTRGDRLVIPLDVPAPRPWSADGPNLYDLVVTLANADRVLDTYRAPVGLRTVTTSGRDGLRINGRPALLRGGNIHHDNGVLGAATFRDAEFRRARILKEAGFNAIRSAHNPLSRAMLEACDVHGLYVVDELCDGWYDHKVEHDDADQFEATWRQSADAMVAKDRNHPSVLFYSIGNENSEPVTAYGVETVRRMADHIRSSDPDRGVTVGVNLMSAALAWPAKRKGRADEQPPGKAAPNMNSAMVNVLTNQFARLMKLAPRLKRTDAVTRDVFAHVDVAGYNYGTVRYARDARSHPDRVIVGTETVPGDIAETWSLVEDSPNVIGDFMWSGWDYLGEAGIGVWQYDDAPRRLYKPYPNLIAGCGAIDLIGVPDASLAHAQAAWGLLERPVITVRPVDRDHRKAKRTAWRSTDAIESWAWAGCDGRPALVEVVSRAEAVELRLNGRSLGRRAVGGNVACFETRYAPGEITAIAFAGGEEVGRSTLRSADAARLRLVREPGRFATNGDDLCFIMAEIADAQGTIEACDDEVLEVRVEGPATLAGFGNAAPASEESFVDLTHSTYRGRALVVLRAGDRPGLVTLTVTGRRHGRASTTLDATTAV